jgi:uncharacterized membrane protein
MPSKLSLFLIGSLALNAALLGIVAGKLLNSGAKEPSVQTQLAQRPGPTSDVVAAAWAQLPEEDRKTLRKEFRERWTALENDRKLLGEAGKAVHDAAQAEPFDEAKLRDAVIIYQTRQQRMQQSAEDILIRHLAKMPPEARATAAVGLLTPFNARMQRSGDGRGGQKDGQMRGKAPNGEPSAERPALTPSGGEPPPTAPSN